MLLKCDRCGADGASRYEIRLRQVTRYLLKGVIDDKVDLCDGCRMTVAEFFWSLKGGDDGDAETTAP